MKYFDLVIVGGGILGTFHAYHALKRGLRVALLEKDTSPRGATVRNFGQVVPSGMNTKWQLLGRRSTDIYKSIQSKFDISVIQHGSVYIASNEEELLLLEELAQINKRNNYESYLLTKEACLQKYEGLKKSYCKGGLYFPTEISVNPRIAVNRILAYLVEQQSLEYLPKMQVIDLDIKNSCCELQTTNGLIVRAKKVIICSGSNFKTLFPAVFEKSPIEVSKLQMLSTKAQPSQRINGNILTGLTIRRYESFSECPSWKAVKAKEPEDNFAKQYGIHILFKQAEDGTVILGDSHEYANAAKMDDLDFDMNEGINQFIINEAKRIFDLQTWEIEKTWYGVYSQSKTNDIFQHDIEAKIHIVTGIGGKGMTGSAGFAEQHIRALYG